MTQPELNTFRRILEEQLSAASDRINGREALAVDESPDDLDRIQSAAARDSVISSMERSALQLRKGRAALGRIEDGSFGVCLSCENVIHAKRLTAMPSAELCISCQEKEDRERAMRGGRAGEPEEEAA